MPRVWFVRTVVIHGYGIVGGYGHTPNAPQRLTLGPISGIRTVTADNPRPDCVRVQAK
jgi:hypothetical protein